jgi:hypothetical protein
MVALDFGKVHPEGKDVAPPGKECCTSREEMLHPEGRNVAPWGKRTRTNPFALLKFPKP